MSPAAAVLTLTPTFPPATPHPRQLLVPLASIQTFTLLSLPSPPGSATNSAASSTGASSKAAPAPLSAAPPPPLVDPATQAQLLRSAVARAHSEDARRGRGVGQEAQEIFDAIARTLPARWDGSSIVVLDAVVIAPPYRSEDCRAAKSAQAQMLLRVRKVVSSAPTTFSNGVVLRRERDGNKWADEESAVGVRA